MNTYYKHNKDHHCSHDDLSHHNIDLEIDKISKNSKSKSLKFILSMILFFSLIEIIGGYISNSLALVSDGFHMLTDCLAIFIAYVSSKISSKSANEKYSFGYARAEIVGGFINSLFMLSIIFYLFYEAINRLNNNSHEINGMIMLPIALIGLIINIISLKKIHHHSCEEKHNINLKATIIHIIGDLLGSLAAIISGLIIYFYNIYIIDAILTLFIATILLLPTIKIIKNSIDVFMLKVPENIKSKEVGDYIFNLKHNLKNIQIKELHDLHIWHINYDNFSLSCHLKIILKNNETKELNDLMIKIQNGLDKNFQIKHSTIQFEIET